jgi:zinc transporter
VTQEELNSRLSEQMNKRMYVLALVAAIFLPLGLITGLLGLNVGGIPGSQSALGIAFVSVFLIFLGALQLLLLKKRQWF